MLIFSQIIFQAVRWAARKGLREEENFASEAKKREARRTGMRGETFAYWYLRRQGYVFVARNYMPRGAKGELDLVGYDVQPSLSSQCERTLRSTAKPAFPK
jgi:hypothetical protein